MNICAIINIKHAAICQIICRSRFYRFLGLCRNKFSKALFKCSLPSNCFSCILHVCNIQRNIQVVFRWSKVLWIRWEGENMPSETLEFFMSLPCNVWKRVVVKEEDLVFFLTKSCFKAIQLYAVDIDSYAVLFASSSTYIVNDFFMIPPGTEHHLFLGEVPVLTWNSCFTATCFSSPVTMFSNQGKFRRKVKKFIHACWSTCGWWPLSSWDVHAAYLYVFPRPRKHWATLVWLCSSSSAGSRVQRRESSWTSFRRRSSFTATRLPERGWSFKQRSSFSNFRNHTFVVS